MYIHEYQAKALLARRGIPVPAGQVALSPEQAGRLFDEMHLSKGMVKAQIHAGGRGKAGGILPVSSRRECEAATRRLLGHPLVTPQTGPRGRPVDKVLIQEYIRIDRELYVGISLDRSRGCPMTIGSAAGGVEIESVGRAGIAREYGSPRTGLTPFQARKLCVGMGLPHEFLKPMSDILLAMGSLFISLDCSLVELNPLAVSDGKLVAADAKITFDDNALFRHPELGDLRDPAQEDPREVEARRHDLSYVGLDGNIGCMVNGAGLAMATLDLIRLSGGEPANFLDVGGDATAEKVVAAFRLLLRDPRVRAILVNIFGGIVRCDLIAQGILEAVKQVDLTVPLVVRLEGNMAPEARALLAGAGLNLISADSLQSAAEKAVARAREGRSP